MGACSVGGSFYSTDWRSGVGCRFGKDRETGKIVSKELTGMSGIDAIVEEARIEYGDDPYSGTVATCSFRYIGDISYKKEKEIDKYINERMDDIDKRAGEVAKVATMGYIICNTNISEIKYGLPFDSRYYLRQARKGPAVLVEERGNGYFRVVEEGTVAELKKAAHQLLRQNNYGTYYYLVGKNTSYFCTYKGKFQAKTTRKSDDKNLVLPVNKYVYYGWAAE